MRAAVLNGVDQPLEIRDDVEVDPPRAGEVKVRMAAAAVCHSDLSIQNGTLPYHTPLVMGHEGAGVVEEVGEGVGDLAPGDHVVVSWVPQCGQCFYCLRGARHLCEKAPFTMATGGLLDGTSRFGSRGATIYQALASGTFSDVTVVPAIGAVKVEPDIDLRVAALLGCGVLTGVGAALNSARIAPGDRVAVVGCGGVGLNVIQGARIAGADEIIAVDMNETKLALAKDFGATATVNVAQGDPVSQVMTLTGEHGADVAFEVIGLPTTIDQTITMARRGGQAVLVGVPRLDAILQIPTYFGLVMADKTIRGSWLGGSDIRRDVPRLVDLYRQGQLKLNELISRTLPLEEVNAAFEAMKTGEVARSVVVL